MTGDRLEAFYRRRQLEVFLRQRSLAVGGEDEGHLVPADVDIGVVVGGLGHESHPYHESHRLCEIGEDKGPANHFVFQLPSDVFFKKGSSVGFGEFHGPQAIKENRRFADNEGRKGGHMRNAAVMLRTFVLQEEGASLVEYAFILLLMVVVSIVVVANLGEYPAAAFESVDTGFGGP